MLELARRNTLLYFRDRAAVLLSLLADAIMAVLYILFLRSDLISAIPAADAAELADTWMLAGVIAVTPVMTAMGAGVTAAADNSGRSGADILVSPAGGFDIAAGYYLSSAFSALLLTLALGSAGGIYMYACYSVIPCGRTLLLAAAVILLCCISGAALALPIVSLLKSNGALAGCCTIAGALIGFLAGIYIPVGRMPHSIAEFIVFFPPAHCAALMRRVLMEPLALGATGELLKYMGAQLYRGEALITPGFSALALLFFSALMVFAASLLYRRKSRS